MRALEEHADLERRLAKLAATNGLEHVSEGFARVVHDAHGQAQTIGSVLFAATTESPAMVGAAVAAEDFLRGKRRQNLKHRP